MTDQVETINCKCVICGTTTMFKIIDIMEACSLKACSLEVCSHVKCSTCETSICTENIVLELESLVMQEPTKRLIFVNLALIKIKQAQRNLKLNECANNLSKILDEYQSDEYQSPRSCVIC